jgi:hypothetical protein
MNRSCSIHTLELKRNIFRAICREEMAPTQEQLPGNVAEAHQFVDEAEWFVCYSRGCRVHYDMKQAKNTILEAPLICF